jgi:hypothetical protein
VNNVINYFSVNGTFPFYICVLAEQERDNQTIGTEENDDTEDH